MNEKIQLKEIKFHFIFKINFHDQVQTSNKNLFYYRSKQTDNFPPSLSCLLRHGVIKFYDLCHFAVKKKIFESFVFLRF